MRLDEINDVTDEDPLAVTIIKRKLEKGDRVYFIGASGRPRRVVDITTSGRAAGSTMYGIVWPKAAVSGEIGTSWRTGPEADESTIELGKDDDGPAFYWTFKKSGLI
jgi:hypothetical protein